MLWCETLYYHHQRIFFFCDEFEEAILSSSSIYVYDASFSSVVAVWNFFEFL